MFAFISGGYHPWDNFFIYHCNDITMVLYHVIKRISHGLWLDMISIQLVCILFPRQGSGIDNTQLVG